MIKPFFIFFRNSIDKGILLVFATILGIVLPNSVFAKFYHTIIHSKIILSINDNTLTIPFHLLVNDFLMSIFFLVISIEIKKELLHGHLSTKSQRILPVFCAMLGVIVPCIIYIIVNKQLPYNLIGCAIPTATDIAFTITMISMFSNKVPKAIKIFVTALAIIDDFIAVIAIAIFYTTKLNFIYLLAIKGCTLILTIMNRKNITKTFLYLIIGIIMFVFFLYSGIHSTISGVVLGFCIPMHNGEKISQYISKFVTRFIMPVFAFFNSGICLECITIHNLFNAVTLGVFLGLFLGKQFGIFGGFYLLLKAKIVTMPAKSKLQDVYIAAVLCGIGFTMSLFIASLAFSSNSLELINAKIGILFGSLLSALYGYLLLRYYKEA